jgi:predicted dithiol-disulfide oxidoreductase (DUF899 family)
LTSHAIATPEQAVAARAELLAREKEHTRMGDELAQQRRELPWVQVEKDYRLHAEDGERHPLAELLDGRSQLLVYHFMYGPSYQNGCPTNSSIADAIDGVVPHLNARDVTMLLVSSAPLATLQANKRRMGWSVPWASADGSDFNTGRGYSSSEEQVREWLTPVLDTMPPIVAHNANATGTDPFGYLTETHGFSVFALEDGQVYETYSTGGRGVEFLMSYYAILDRTPVGRDEVEGFQRWLRRHEEYESHGA